MDGQRRQGARGAIAAACALTLAAAACEGPAEDPPARAVRAAAAAPADDEIPADSVWSVALDVPLAPPADDEAHRARVRAAQDSLLAALPPDEVEVVRRFAHVPGLALRLRTPRARAAARAHRAVRALGPDVAGGAHLGQSVPFVGAPTAHAAGLTGQGRRVAVVDTGIDTDHPDLLDDLVDGACFCVTDGGCCPGGTATGLGLASAEDDTGHGTHVSGIITSGGVVAAGGVAPDAELIVVRVMRNGRFGTSSDIVAALDWIRVFHPTVDAVNLSLGTNALFPAACERAAAGYIPPPFMANLDSAVQSLLQVGVLSVASSGNDGDKQRLTAPACLSDTIAVGAVGNASNSVASFSNSNAGLDLWAPGVSISSSFIGGGTDNANGTSMATPHVVGAVALARQNNAAHPVATVRACLTAGGASATDPANAVTRPRLDVAAAVSACGDFGLGVPCAFAAECASGFCADGVCCNSACGGTATDCAVCAVAAGAAEDGTCATARAGAVCRPEAGACDVAEACDGASTACPADAVRGAGASCRPAAGPCDLPEACTGAAAACPVDAKFGGICRPPSGPCDRPESCNGVADACPEDEVWGAAIACRPSEGACDPAEMCTGTSTACPADARRSDECRPAAGACDVAEVCDGVAADCPPDGRAALGTVCRPEAGPCDRPERCDGAAAACPADGKRSSVCRAAAGACDVAEVCDGVSDGCPGDTLQGPGVTCRPAAGACDVPEACTGTGAACPPDDKWTRVCRPSAGACDVAERCDGVGDDCPADVVRTSTVVCRRGADACDAPERCDGATGACPADARAADGAPCGDGVACNGAEVCRAGECVAGPPPDCDDGDPCTVGQCVEPGGCAFTAVPGCCRADADCDDGDACTTDACVEGACVTTARADCCRADAECPAPAGACATAACVDGACVEAPIEGCRLAAGEGCRGLATGDPGLGALALALLGLYLGRRRRRCT